MKQYALDLNKEQWTELLEKLGEPKFRADQLLDWLWKKHVYDAGEMSNLSKGLREKLAQEIDFALPVIVREQRSKDGTRKFLWQLRDGNSIESVLLKSGSRLTACISTQIGCPLGCTFCATGLSGFVRNLSSGEIAGQFLAMEARLGREINNVVYMGMGEPMLNKDEVFKSVRMLNDERLRGLGIRHITISTCGIVPGIEAMAQEQLGARLAVSLHAVDDELRSRLMPVNERYPLAELKEAVKSYQETTKDRVSVEYVLFGGVNDSVEHARALVRFLKGIHVFINLIPFNPVDGRYDAPQARDILKFRKVLETAGFENELREEQGSDIDAACGQLRRKDAEGIAVAFEPKAYSVTNKDGRRQETADNAQTNPKRMATQKSRVLKRSQTAGETKTTASRKKHVKTAGSDKRMDTAGTKFYENIKGKKTRRKVEDDSAFDKSAKKTPRKKSLPEKERYRSGKMKEARPVYRGSRDDARLGGDEQLPNSSRAAAQKTKLRNDKRTKSKTQSSARNVRSSQKKETKTKKRGAKK